MPAESVTINNPEVNTNYPIVLLLGAVGAAIAGAGFVAPWTLALMGAGLGLALSFVANEAFLLALVFLIPLDFTLRGDVLIRDIAVAARLLVVIGYFLGSLSRGQFDPRRFWRPNVTKAACLFLACLTISMLFGDSGETHVELRGIFFVGGYVGYYLMMLDWLRSGERRRRITKVLFCSALIVGIFGFVQLFAGSYTAVWHFLYRGQEAAMGGIEEQGRITSFLGHPNHLAVYMNLITPFGLACWLSTNERRWKWLGGATVVLGVISLTLTQSRGGYLAFVAIIVYSIWHFAKTRRQKVLLALVFSFVAVSAYSLLQLWNPRHFADYTSDMSVLARLYLWSTAWNFFLSSPLHGVGIGTFAILFEPYLANIPGIDPTVPLEAHNIYFALLAETGILGFLSFLALVVTAYREARRQFRSPDWFQRTFAFGVAGGIVGILVGEFFDHSLLWAPQVGFLFWLEIAGLVASIPKGENTRKGTVAN
jgi:O-antigen ligase